MKGQPAYLYQANDKEGFCCLAMMKGSSYPAGEADAALIVEAVNAYDALRAALTETLAVSAAAMRVLAHHSLADEFEEEVRPLGIPDGFGVRAQAALALGKTDPP